MIPWLLLVYSVPRHPSASRVYVWRKLKQLGAEAIQDAVWVLPATARTHEQLQWLAAEMREMGGQALLWSGQLASPEEHRTMVRRFEEPVELGYRALLHDLKKTGADPAALAKRFQQLQARDYFQCALGREVRAVLTGGKKGAKT